MKNSSIITLFFGILLFTSIPIHIFADLQPQWVIDKYEAHKHKTMAYRLLRPINFDSTKVYPVVITLHNGPGMADSTQIKAYNIVNLRYMNQKFVTEPLRSDYPAYIFCPQASSRFSISELKLCKEIIATFKSVDMNRIYVMGQSMGGVGTYAFLTLDPAYFAAAIPCAGFENESEAPKLANSNIWAIHGNTDTTVPYTKDSLFFQAMKKLNAKMKFTSLIKIGHSTETRMIANYMMSNTPVIIAADSLKNGYITQAAGPDFDPEPNTMKWMFSKSKNTNTALSSVNSDNLAKSIYFNSTNSTVSWSNNIIADRIVIYDVAGKVITQFSTTNTNYVNISLLESGMYILRFYNQNLLAFSEKVIKTSK